MMYNDGDHDRPKQFQIWVHVGRFPLIIMYDLQVWWGAVMTAAVANISSIHETWNDIRYHTYQMYKILKLD